MKNLEIYTDGGCVPNPGFGACAFVVVEGGTKVIHQKSFKKPDTTNNIMELSGVIAALMWVKEHHPKCRVYLNTDSQYVQLGITQWLAGWVKRGWKTTDRKPVKNQELWVMLNDHVNELEVHFQWVKGHSNNKFNTLADQLCTEVLKKHSGQTGERA